MVGLSLREFLTTQLKYPSLLMRIDILVNVIQSRKIRKRGNNLWYQLREYPKKTNKEPT